MIRWPQLSYSGIRAAPVRRTAVTSPAGSSSAVPLESTPSRPVAADVDAWAPRHLDEVEGRSPSTVARRLSAVAGFYRWAVAEDVVGRNPVAAVRRPKVGSESQSTGLDRDELSALIAASVDDGPRSAALVLLLGMNGLRVSEVVGAYIGDLDTERGHRVLRITRKGGRRQTVPLAPRTAEAVDILVGERTTGPRFVTSSGARMDRIADLAVTPEAGSSSCARQGREPPSSRSATCLRHAAASTLGRAFGMSRMLPATLTLGLPAGTTELGTICIATRRMFWLV